MHILMCTKSRAIKRKIKHLSTFQRKATDQSGIIFVIGQGYDWMADGRPYRACNVGELTYVLRCFSVMLLTPKILH